MLWCVVRFRIGIEAIRLVADAMSVEGLKDALMRGPSHGEPVLVLAGQAGDQKIIDCLLKSLDPEARDRFVHYCQSYPAPKG